MTSQGEVVEFLSEKILIIAMRNREFWFVGHPFYREKFILRAHFVQLADSIFIASRRKFDVDDIENLWEKLSILIEELKHSRKFVLGEELDAYRYALKNLNTVIQIYGDLLFDFINID